MDYSMEKKLVVVGGGPAGLAAALAAIPGMQGVLEKSIGAEILDDRYILNCKVRCIENIAETKNIEIGALR